MAFPNPTVAATDPQSPEQTESTPKRELKGLRIRCGVRCGPNRRAHDYHTDHNWQLEIEGVTL